MNFKFRSNDTFSVFVCEGYQVEHGLNEYMDSPKIHEKKGEELHFIRFQFDCVCITSM